MFGKKKKQLGMSVDELRKLDRRGLKYACERDSETAREIKIGDSGAINIIDGCFVLVCGGKYVFRCSLGELRAAELMNLSGITLKGFDLETNRERSIIAYYTENRLI